jgi:hypothetical protein
MPIPTDRLVNAATTMGERSRRLHVTRDDARSAILGFAHAWNAAHRDPTPPTTAQVNAAIRAYAIARRARFSAQKAPTLIPLFRRVA